MTIKPRALEFKIALKKMSATPKYLNTSSVLKLQVERSSGVYFRSNRKSLQGLCVQKGYEITEMKSGVAS